MRIFSNVLAAAGIVNRRCKSSHRTAFITLQSHAIFPGVVVPTSIINRQRIAHAPVKMDKARSSGLPQGQALNCCYKLSLAFPWAPTRFSE